ncbi:hypothetical protein TPHA_0N01840 [Tetrapisispora phaffii CBS 4417]|uniref:Protein farnesyltransferase/geranylgeranyltransferase type-1 subunit alpha n=1 Tax=Tetrapisispora phaffii (strain ATCC 24235 / CBS 4417 / NBRC 1672 / NRRL Y-8282 / UCD 70-5) TaxID=1071381 RepID=G8C1D7_TETPH|nr:hypothetical protein TPHA_0N01840 [Tetrapisispora phaffii CBS 4417]CCE65965.1 hypothetical protein TPHA_0N01840 [Tetrapisispora phaffii CBS 4417]
MMSEFDVSLYSDIEPLPIETGLDNELCQIMYTDEYKQVIGIARRLISNGEFSERALDLTSCVIDLSPAFYTIWNYRFNIVTALMAVSGDIEAFLNKELDWLDEVTLNNPKNYQIWSYRQALLEVHPNASLKRELPVLEMMIDEDTKNYHVWSYRKWCVQKFNDFTNEFQFADSLIEKDIYNNSAWTHRMFVLKNLTSNKNEDNWNEQLKKETIDFEIEYAKQKITLCPQNVSSWNYLRGILDKYFDEDYTINGIDEFAIQYIDNIFEKNESELTETNSTNLPQLKSSYALQFVADGYSRIPDKKNMAIKAYKSLSIKYDPIRRGLWNHMISKLSA